MIDDLEKQVTEKWGPLQFDWTIGRTVNDGVCENKDGDIKNPDHHIWFYFCGTNEGKWKHHGYGKTIKDCLLEMLKL